MIDEDEITEETGISYLTDLMNQDGCLACKFNTGIQQAGASHMEYNECPKRN